MFALLYSVLALTIAEMILRGRRFDQYEKVATGCSYRDIIAIGTNDALCIEVYEYKFSRRSKSGRVKSTQFQYYASLKHVNNGVLLSDITDWYPETIPRRLASQLILLDIACIHIQLHASKQGQTAWKQSTKQPCS